MRDGRWGWLVGKVADLGVTRGDTSPSSRRSKLGGRVERGISCNSLNACRDCNILDFSLLHVHARSLARSGVCLSDCHTHTTHSSQERTIPTYHATR